MDDKQRFIKGKEITAKGLIFNSLLTLFKLAAGFIGTSQAMIADGVHSLSDVATDIVVILGLSLSCRPRDKTHPYGHGKFETIAATSVGLALLAVAFKIAHDAINSLLLKTHPTPGAIALVAAIISIITKEWLYQRTVSLGKKINSQALIANAWHHRSDALSSVAALFGIGMARIGLPIFDPIAALLVCIFIAKVSFDIIKSSLAELVETSVETETIKKIGKIALSHTNVASVHGIKARRVGPKIVAELHIVLNPNMKLSLAHAIAEMVEKEIVSQIREIDEVLIHIDPRE